MEYVIHKVEKTRLGRVGLVRTDDFFTLLGHAYAIGGNKILQEALKESGILEMPVLEEAYNAIIIAVENSDLFKIKCKCKLKFEMTIEN